jgi:hypothetical protein
MVATGRDRQRDRIAKDPTAQARLGYIAASQYLDVHWRSIIEAAKAHLAASTDGRRDRDVGRRGRCRASVSLRNAFRDIGTYEAKMTRLATPVSSA